MYTFGPTLSRHDALPIVWFLLTTAAAISIAGNALHAYISETARLDPMVAVIGGTIPPAFLLLSTHGLVLLLRLRRSEEHTSELQSLMRISYAVFCLKKKNMISQSCTIPHQPTLS